MLALGIIVPVLPKLVLEFEGGDSAQRGRHLGLFGTVFAAMQFLFAPLLGALSDRFGRRPVVLLSNFGLGLDYFVMALAPTVALAVRRAASSRASCGASYHDGGRVHRRRDAAREARARASACSSAAFGIGFVVGPGARRARSAASTRGCRSGSPAGSASRTRCTGSSSCPSRCRRERRAPFTWSAPIPLGALELLRSARATCSASPASFPRRHRARGAAEHVRAVHRLSLRLGRAHGRPRRWPPSAC